MTGPTKLRAYLKRNRLTHDQFAASAGVAGQMIYFWLSEARRPNLENAFLLEAATGGAVKATDWIPKRSTKSDAA